MDQKLRTTARGVRAAGDLTGGLQFKHVADYLAKAVAQNALFPLKKNVEYGNVSCLTYAGPEVPAGGGAVSRKPPFPGSPGPSSPTPSG